MDGSGEEEKKQMRVEHACKSYFHYFTHTHTHISSDGKQTLAMLTSL